MYTLPKLNISFSSLEPWMDAQTFELHYTKHHQAYITKLNQAIEKHPHLFEKNVESLLVDLNNIPDNIRTDVRNMGGGHYNHCLFWDILGPSSQTKEPKGPLMEDIKKTFGSFREFVEKLSATATNHFGSGWGWLSLTKDKKLIVESTHDHDCPLSSGKTPLMVVDVWEHAYYLKYQNKRADFVQAFWNIVDWNKVESIYTTALSLKK